jgi:hypothetical protein
LQNAADGKRLGCHGAFCSGDAYLFFIFFVPSQIVNGRCALLLIAKRPSKQSHAK